MAQLESIAFQNAFTGSHRENSTFSITCSHWLILSRTDLTSLKSLTFHSFCQENCSNFDTLVLDSLKRDVVLTITEDALPNIIHFSGDATKLVNTIAINSKSLEYVQHVDASAPILSVPCYTRRLYVDEGCCKTQNIATTLFSPCILLRFISIASNSLQESQSLILSSMPQLVRVVIGDRCFCPSAMVVGSFTVRDCPRLVSITVGENSFTRVTTTQLIRLKSFASLDMAGSSFQSCLVFTVSQCEVLSLLLFPKESLPIVTVVEIVGRHV